MTASPSILQAERLFSPEVETTAVPLMRGATVSGGATEFRVWAPAAKRLTLRLSGAGDFPMERAGEEFVLRRKASPGQRYFYIVDGSKPVPDPVSRLLPEGVHGPTEIVDSDAFRWTDQSWRGVAMRDYVLYELHVGTFTPQGTFDGVIERLDYLKRLGVTAMEIMPVAAFPGERNWGYDGVSPYGVQASYGGPDGLKRLVDAAHGAGLAVVLDVVYNHLGAEGNYLRLFGPYFTDKHTTPWGDAVNYDQTGSEGVRRYVIENALYWIREYHLDGLRLDAIQTIKDDSPKHIVTEIQENVQRLAKELGREVCVIAETDENDAEIVRPENAGGWGLDGVWSDDFHHAVHAYFTGERKGYYQDFGRPEQIAMALEQGFVFQGEWFEFWKAQRGTPPEGVPLEAHVICTQNHDQVGNRAVGERLTALVPRGVRKLSAALLLLAPETPLLFMGQEYDERRPFQFFSSYGDPALQKAVREGRRNEFKDFAWDEVPDPQDAATFERSKLKLPSDVAQLPEDQREMLDWYRTLLGLRRELISQGERSCRAELQGDALVLQVPRERPRVMVIVALRAGTALPEAPSGWTERLTSDEDGYRVRVLTGSVSTASK